MRDVVLNDERELGRSGHRTSVDRHLAQRGRECLGSLNSDAAEGDVMRRSDQDHAVDRASFEPCEGSRRNGTGIDITCMGNDDRLRRTICRKDGRFRQQC